MKDLAEVVQTFLFETGSSQLVRGFTRSEIVRGGAVSRSLIDHCYSNASGKVSTPEVTAVGTSDHLGIFITKYTRAPILKPKVTLKRSYKDFNAEDFWKEVVDSDVNKDEMAIDIEGAALEFENKFNDILDKHAPIKVFQGRLLKNWRRISRKQ